MNLLKDNREKYWFGLENDLVDRTDLTVYEKMVYVVLKRYYAGPIKLPSINILATQSGCNKKQFVKSLNILKDKDIISSDIEVEYE